MTRGKLSAMCAALLLHGVAFGGWAYRSTLTVSGYSGSETLSGFPVLVRLSPQTVPGFAYQDCKVANGGDLRFTSLDGNTVYPHEIDEWNEDGESLVWVKLPSLPAGGMSFYLRYGNPDAPTPADGSAVWSGNAGGNYAGVWHMNEEITSDVAAATASRDSAKRAAALGAELSMDALPRQAAASTTAESLGEMVSTNGVVGRARVNASGDPSADEKNRLMTGNYRSLALGSTFAFSGWILNARATSSEVFSRKSGWGDANGFQLFVASNGRESTVQYRSSSSDLKSFTFTPDSQKRWVHYAVVCNGTSHSIYVDGALQLTETVAEVVENDLGFAIGARAGAGAGSLFGQYDEVRLLDAVPSADWVAAAYATMAEPNFVTATSAIVDEPDVLVVTADGDMEGLVPSCGIYRNLRDGEVVVCSAPDAADILTETTRRRFAGWSLYRCDVSSGSWTLVDSAATNQLRYVHVGGSAACRLEWKVVLEYRHAVSVSPSGYGTVTAGGNTLEDGYLWAEENAVVAAVPGVGKSFAKWTGSGPWTEETQPSFTLDTTESLTFAANFYRSDSQGWRKKVTMTVRPTGGTETLVGFPVLVRISSDRIKGFDYADCRAGGADIKFTSADGTVAYPHEIDEWNVGGESIVWVKLPALSSDGTMFLMLFDNEGAPSQENALAVWSGNAGGNYAGVWHMNEEITSDVAAATASRDSAKRAAALGVELSMDATPLRDSKDTTSESLGEMVSTNGVVGRARVNASSHGADNTCPYNQRLSAPNYDGLNVGSTFSISGWFHSDVTPRSCQILNRKSSWQTGTAFNLQTGNNNVNSFNFSGGNSTSYDVTKLPSIVADWVHVALVCDDTTLRLYVNGALQKEVTDAAAVQDNGELLGIGARGTGGYNALVGQYDEVRLLDAVPSADWIKAAYDTMTDGDFVTMGRVKKNGSGLLIVVR